MANRIKEKYMAGKRYFDYPMLFLVIFLICFGLVMIYSTSSYKSTVTYGNSYHWLLRQAVAIVLGAVAMVVCCKLDYRIMKSEKFGNGCYWASIVLLVLVLIIGAAKKGAVRWIASNQLVVNDGLAFKFVLQQLPLLFYFVQGIIHDSNACYSVEVMRGWRYGLISCV